MGSAAARPSPHVQPPPARPAVPPANQNAEERPAASQTGAQSTSQKPAGATDGGAAAGRGASKRTPRTPQEGEEEATRLTVQVVEARAVVAPAPVAERRGAPWTASVLLGYGYAAHRTQRVRCSVAEGGAIDVAPWNEVFEIVLKASSGNPVVGHLRLSEEGSGEWPVVAGRFVLEYDELLEAGARTGERWVPLHVPASRSPTGELRLVFRLDRPASVRPPPAPPAPPPHASAGRAGAAHSKTAPRRPSPAASARPPAPPRPPRAGPAAPSRRGRPATTGLLAVPTPRSGPRSPAPRSPAGREQALARGGGGGGAGGGAPGEASPFRTPLPRTLLPRLGSDLSAAPPGARARGTGSRGGEGGWRRAGAGAGINLELVPRVEAPGAPPAPAPSPSTPRPPIGARRAPSPSPFEPPSVPGTPFLRPSSPAPPSEPRSELSTPARVLFPPRPPAPPRPRPCPSSPCRGQGSGGGSGAGETGRAGEAVKESVGRGREEAEPLFLTLRPRGALDAAGFVAVRRSKLIAAVARMKAQHARDAAAAATPAARRVVLLLPRNVIVEEDEAPGAPSAEPLSIAFA
eukprot:tig00021796_g23557.t1